LLGVVIALGGFWYTIQNVKDSKRAADRAESAAKETLGRIRYIDAVQNLSRAISIFEEIQRLNRTKEWKVLLDRHQIFRSILVEVKGSIADISNEHKAIIQEGIAQSSSISNTIEIALDKGEKPINVPRMNKILSDQVENLGDILAELRRETDG